MNGGRGTTGRAAQRAARSNGFLVRYTVTVFLNVIAEWAIFLGVLIYAFDRGGSAATGYAAIAMLVPYVVFSPLAGALAERHPPQRVRLGAIGLQTLAFFTAAAAAYGDLDTAFVVAPAMIGIGGATFLGPAGAVLRPAIVRSSQELTVANLWTGYADSLSVLCGPLLAAVMLGVGGSPAVILACGVVSALGLGMSLIRRPLDPPGGSDLDERIGAIALMRRELRAVRSRPGILGVLAVAGGQYFLVGSIDIIVVVAAEDEFGLGPTGPGTLAAALGVGTVLSSAISTLLVRRPRLAPMLGAAMIVLTAASVVLGLALTAIMAFVLLPIMGIARSVQEMLGQVLLQRSADPRSLGPIFAALELAAGLALILGSVVAQILIAVDGVRLALFGTGAYFVVLLAITVRSLRSADDSADVPVVAMSLLRHLPVFEPLPRSALEAVARSAIEVDVQPGDTVIRQGELGDRFYAVSHGEFEVGIDGDTVARCARGDSFGEIALLADVPRAATITATGAGSLLAIDRTPFLVAVTGHDSSRQAAWGVMQRHQGDQAPVDGPHQFTRPDDIADTA